MMHQFTRYRPSVNILVVGVVPLLFAPLVAEGPTNQCLYIIILMGIFWMTNVLPIAVTALIPIVLSPLFKINPSNIVTAAYASDSIFLCFGRLFIACAFRQNNIHKRITLKLLSVVPPQMKWIMLAFMLSSYILSIFISNNASAALMLDIVVDFTTLLRVVEVESDECDDVKNKPSDRQKAIRRAPQRKSGLEMREIIENKRKTVTSISIRVKDEGITKRQSVIIQEKRLRSISTALALATAYAATIAAAGSLVACGPNLTFYGYVQKTFKYNTSLNYASFLLFALPVGIVSLIIVWLWVAIFYIGTREFFCRRQSYQKERRLQMKIKQDYKDLGPISMGEVYCITLTMLLLLLWFTRKYHDIGWKMWFEDSKTTYVTDVQPIFIIVLLMFIIPTKFVHEKSSDGKYDKESNTVLSWATVLKHFNWSSLFLLGSGFAIVDICKTSKLTEKIFKGILDLSQYNSMFVMFVSSILCTAATEFFSATTLFPVLLPVFMCLAQEHNVNPLKYGLSLTLSSSFAFSMPIATSPNLTAFTKNLAKPLDFLKTGIILDILFSFLICLFVQTYGSLVFDLGDFPQWANKTQSNCTSI